MPPCRSRQLDNSCIAFQFHTTAAAAAAAASAAAAAAAETAVLCEVAAAYISISQIMHLMCVNRSVPTRWRAQARIAAAAAAAAAARKQ